jgi:hypothetical protein
MPALAILAAAALASALVSRRVESFEISALLLLSDAASVDLKTLRGGASLPGWLLGTGTPATIALRMRLAPCCSRI